MATTWHVAINAIEPLFHIYKEENEDSKKIGWPQ